MADSHSRASLAAVLGAALLLSTGAASADDLTVISHNVHRMITTTGSGGDLVAEWSEKSGAGVEWLTFNVPEIHDRLYREVTLATSTLDVGFIADRYIRPQYPDMFEPLDDFLASAPIEGFDEFPQSILDYLTFDGKLYGIPIRHATVALHVNKAILDSLGLPVPTTFEEVLDTAHKATFTRDDGVKVHGLLIADRSPAMMLDIARPLYNADFLTSDFELKFNSKEIVDTVELIRTLYADGVLPEAFITFTAEDYLTYMQQGRAAMVIAPFSRHANLNNPDQSTVVGDIVTIAVPASASLESDVAPIRTEFSAMVMPKNSDQKDLAWSFIREMSSPEATVREALNGNGPVRPSAYSDARIAESVVYSEQEQAAVRVARPPFPGFENTARLEDIFKEEMDAVLLGLKSAEAAMNDVQNRVAPLLP